MLNNQRLWYIASVTGRDVRNHLLHCNYLHDKHIFIMTAELHVSEQMRFEILARKVSVFVNLYVQLTLDRHTVVTQASGPSILTLVWFCKGPVYNCPLCQILVTHFTTAVWLICMLQQSFSNTSMCMMPCAAPRQYVCAHCTCG